MKKGISFKLIKSFIGTTILFLLIIIILSILWVQRNYENVGMDEIVFHLTEPIIGVEKGFILSYLFEALIPSIIILIFLVLLKKHILSRTKQFEYIIEIFVIKIKKKIQFTANVKLLINLIIWMTTLLLTILCLYKINFIGYMVYSLQTSDFIENNYVDSEKVKLEFPKEKRNLIYIFVESFESTYFSKDLGGAFNDNLLPEMYELAEENIHFSNNSKMGGAIEISNVSWTSAAIVAQTSGLPLKINNNAVANEKMTTFLPGAYTLGDILDEAGYNQMIMFGSDASFGNRNLWFKQHGNYEIYDYYTAIENKKISSDYKVWWGFEDSKLFKYAKEEITKLASKNEPFNFSMLTANTHHIGGYMEKNCSQNYELQFSNVISCTSQQLNDFIKWIKNQDFYDNTTIVISGDHLSMDPDYFDNIDDNYDRRIFDLYINSAIDSENTNNRQFSTVDLFPTTLASLGVKIEGNKLGLGTNLFSDEKTLIEKYGLEKVNEEIYKKSTFYDQKFALKK